MKAVLLVLVVALLAHVALGATKVLAFSDSLVCNITLHLPSFFCWIGTDSYSLFGSR